MKVEEKKLKTIYSLCIFRVLSSDIAPTVCRHFDDICRGKLHSCQQVATACYLTGLVVAKINLQPVELTAFVMKVLKFSSALLGRGYELQSRVALRMS
jgi:hypothetical protein